MPKTSDIIDYKELYSLERRKGEAENILVKYPDRIPIIVQLHQKEKLGDIRSLDKKKYLVPADLTVAQFQYVIRRRLRIPPDQSIFFFTKIDTILGVNAQIGLVYDDLKDEDGFLYIRYAFHETFG